MIAFRYEIRIVMAITRRIATRADNRSTPNARSFVTRLLVDAGEGEKLESPQEWRPYASWVCQVGAYVKDIGNTGLASVWGMARRRSIWRIRAWRLCRGWPDGGLSEGYGPGGPGVCLGDGQTEAYVKDMGMAGLASACAMARRRPI